MRKILLFIIILSIYIGCRKEDSIIKNDPVQSSTPTNYIIAGLDSNIWTYIDIIPDINPTIYSRTNNNHEWKGLDSLDLFGDSLFDLGCRLYYKEEQNYELRRWEYYWDYYITVLNKSKISIAGPFLYGDTINSELPWQVDSIHTHEFYKDHCVICDWEGYYHKVYLGVRYINNQDSIYSWIQIKAHAGFAEYAFNKK